jgi:hypothetical protein
MGNSHFDSVSNFDFALYTHSISVFANQNQSCTFFVLPDAFFMLHRMV